MDPLTLVFVSKINGLTFWFNDKHGPTWRSTLSAFSFFSPIYIGHSFWMCSSFPQYEHHMLSLYNTISYFISSYLSHNWSILSCNHSIFLFSFSFSIFCHDWPSIWHANVTNSEYEPNYFPFRAMLSSSENAKTNHSLFFLSFNGSCNLLVTSFNLL